MTWQESLRNCISTPEELALRQIKHGGFSKQAHIQFPLRIPESFLEQINLHDADDPLLKQVLPDHLEETGKEGFSCDPLDEHKYETTPGILHKYHGRVLLLVTGTCAIHCRYCFRRHFPYSESNPLHTHWPASLKYIRKNRDVREVIFSGGDPLTLTDEKIAALIRDLENIKHLHRLRIHTRIPVVLPDRVTNPLLQIFNNTRLDPVVVLHVNHPNELGIAAKEAISKIRLAGIPLLNQSVLLSGVNDNAEILIALSETLFAEGVLPYYLHLLDPVEGAGHFEVARTDAIWLHEELQRKLPGYLVPRLVQEISGSPCKQPVVQA